MRHAPAAKDASIRGGNVAVINQHLWAVILGSNFFNVDNRAYPQMQPKIVACHTTTRWLDHPWTER